MSNDGMDRRRFLARTGLAAFGAALVVESGDAWLDGAAQLAVPNSSGTALPKLKAPANACDCHAHIYDPARFPPDPKQGAIPASAAMPDYRLFQKRIGPTRAVIVTPRNYGTDNSITLDAIAQLGPQGRGLAVVDPAIADAELKRLHDGGVRGIRFTIRDDATTAGLGHLETMSKRIADLGWHVDLNVVADQLVGIETLLRRLPTPIMLDHMAHPPLPAGAEHPSFAVLRGLLDSGRTWVKLSGAYSNTKVGPPYPDATKIAQALVKAAPERMVWGSDWPHPSVKEPKPDDALLFDLLSEWAPDEATRHRILVENPATVYGFNKSA
jgi:predicted TIM-barrel fold metal-dependent hydrolase